MRLASLLVLALSATSVGAQDTSKAAKAAYRRSIQRKFPLNIKAVIQQRDGKNERSMRSISVKRDRTGRTHYFVISPLRLYGLETADNGERMQTYWKDQNRLIDQDSVLKTEDDVVWRMRVAENNYTFKLLGHARIADRDAIEVELRPKAGGMDTKRFLLDAKYFYPLRIMSVSPSGIEQVQMVTRSITFTTKPLDTRFDVKPVGTPKIGRYERPEKLTAAGVQKRLGFTPMLPTSIPMGFKIQDIQLTNNDEWKAAAIRICDGIVRALVYQWKPVKKDKLRVQAMESNNYAEYNGVAVMIVSDMAPELRERILNAFIEKAQAEAFIGQMVPGWNGTAVLHR